MSGYPYPEVAPNGDIITFKEGYVRVQAHLDDTQPSLEHLKQNLANRKCFDTRLPFNAGGIQAVRDAIKIEERKQR